MTPNGSADTQLFSSIVLAMGALNEIVETSPEAPEVADHNCSSFLFSSARSVCCVTKPLSDVLKGKQLDLSAAMDLVNSICQIISQQQNDDYFMENIW